MQNNQQSSDQEQLQVQDYGELESFWDSFSQAYTNQVSACQAGLYSNMITMLQVDKSTKILETAIGPAFMLPHLLHRVQKGTEIWMTDLSTKFLAIAQKRAEIFLQDPYTYLYNFDVEKLPQFQGPKRFDAINLTLQQENSEKLSFADESFDTYISSLCLQLTTDPVKMLQEAHRVLKKGGRACFSVWGDYDKSTMFNIVPKILAKHNIQMPKSRSNFHLNDRNKLIAMAKEAGFTDILAWNSFTPMDFIKDKNDIDSYIKFPRIQKEAAQAGEEKKELIIQEIQNELERIILQEQQPIGMDILVIVMDKK